MLILQAFPEASNRSGALNLVRIFLTALTQAIVKKIHIPDPNKIESNQGLSLDQLLVSNYQIYMFNNI